MYWKELVEVQNFGFNAITISAIIFVFLLCVLGFVVMLIFPFKKIMFLLFSFGSILALIAQLVEMHKTKAVGVIEIKLIQVYFTGYNIIVLLSLYGRQHF